MELDLKFQVQTKIQKPVADVFDAVYNPDKLSAYFTTGGASARLDPGTTVMWAFAEPPVDDFPVYVKEVEMNKSIAFEWDHGDEKYYRVEIEFEALSANETLIKISEGGWPATERGLEQSYGNCEGWTHMLACMKAYVEYGINLRRGSH